jgi:hypothetical protein
MRIIVVYLTLLILILTSISEARGSYSRGGYSRGGNVRVGGYTRSTGTYVRPYIRTAPDHTRFNNWSTKGNYNPYTGKPGTVNPYR